MPERRIVAAIPMPPREIFISPIGWYGSLNAHPTPVELIGAVIYDDGWTDAVIFDHAEVQVLTGGYTTVELEGDIERLAAP